MIKKWLYTQFAKMYRPRFYPQALSPIAQLLEKILGLAVFNYGGVKLTAGPYALLDHYIIRGYNINPYLTSAFSQYLSEGGVFLDMGANHGVFSLLASRNPKVKVFAFEPSPRELSRLWKNLYLNPQNRVSVLSYGLGEKEQEQDFVLYANDNPGMNSLPEIQGKGSRIKCYFSPLIKLLSEEVLRQTRVCKLDVEGQEMFIFNSLQAHMDLLKQCVFIVEMSPLMLKKVNCTSDDIYHFFNRYGFHYQLGNPQQLDQWEEFFYHPDYNSPLIYQEEF